MIIFLSGQLSDVKAGSPLSFLLVDTVHCNFRVLIWSLSGKHSSSPSQILHLSPLSGSSGLEKVEGLATLPSTAAGLMTVVPEAPGVRSEGSSPGPAAAEA